jgi:hypothetical protein
VQCQAWHGVTPGGGHVWVQSSKVVRLSARSWPASSQQMAATTPRMVRTHGMFTIHVVARECGLVQAGRRRPVPETAWRAPP